ncbi:MAG: SDR family NAD(P)-dependent oxidoreductase [Actinomycetota bacterium]
MGALDGKVAIITGAGHGLGRAHAELFAREGAAGIVVNDLGVGIQENSAASADSADETVRRVRQLGTDAVSVFGDCADMAVGKQMVDTALERFGRLDILVNNAGNLRDRMIYNMTEEEWDRIIRVHLKGHFAATRYATEYWRNESKAGNPVAGRIINTTSAAGLFGNAGQPNYAAAKAGIVGFTLALAFSMERYGVTANVIAPGAETDPTVKIAGAPQELRDAMRVEQVSPLVAFLASDKAAHVNGRIFHVAGGRIDSVTHHQLVRGVIKRGETWTVEELAEVFDAQIAGENPQPVQTIFLELAQDILSVDA